MESKWNPFNHLIKMESKWIGRGRGRDDRDTAAAAAAARPAPGASLNFLLKYICARVSSKTAN